MLELQREGVKDAGAKMYRIGYDWAAANNKVFAGDPSGLSHPNRLRKKGNVASAQARLGRPVATVYDDVRGGNQNNVLSTENLLKQEATVTESRLRRNGIDPNSIFFDGHQFRIGSAPATDAQLSALVANMPRHEGVGLQTIKRAALVRALTDGSITKEEAAKLGGWGKAAAAGLLAAGASGPIFAKPKKD
jgi:hypothetical protein